MTDISLGILASGGGTTAKKILQAIHSGGLKGIHPAVIIYNRKGAGVVQRAIDCGFPKDRIIYIPRRHRPDDEFGLEILEVLECFEVEFIGQYGWMVHTPANVVASFKGKMINQHPGPLDPGHLDFGGKGMHGLAVHCAVLLFNRMTGGALPFTEATAQLVDTEYDLGAILGSIQEPILPSDTPEVLQARLLLKEYEIQIQVLRELGNIRQLSPLPPRSPRLIHPSQINQWREARRIAMQLYP